MSHFHGFRIRIISAIVVTLTLVFLFPFSSASAATYRPRAPLTSCTPNGHCFPAQCGSGDQAANCGQAVTRHSGNVQHHPLVYLIFWGSKWNADTSGTITATQNLFNSLAGSAYNNILTQYYDNQDFVHNDVRLGGTWIDTVDAIPSNISKASFDFEVIQAQARKGWHGTPDTQFIIFPQQGSILDSTLYSGACGEHDYANDSGYQTAYSFVRYASDYGGCNPFGTNAQSMTNIAAHEYAETATDPTGPGFLTGLQSWGWATTDPITDPIEVGDQCQGYNGNVNVSNFDAFIHNAAPLLWDQSVPGCVPLRGQDFTSPDQTLPFHGVHTVQGSILDSYRSLGTTTGLLGEPLTEEIAISNGHVSYFSGQSCNGGGPYSSGSAIYDQSGFSAHEVHGCIYHAYTAAFGGPGGALGYPVSDEQASVRGGRVSYFAGQVCTGGGPFNSGSAIYHYNHTDYEVHGCIYHKYWNLVNSGPGSALGFPTSNEGGVTSGYSGIGARTNTFEHGAIFWTAGMGSFVVQGSIYTAYMSRNGSAGQLGLPVTDEYTTSSGLKESDFENGYITFNPANNQITIVVAPHCC